MDEQSVAVVCLDGIGGNAFKLLARARKAMLTAGYAREKIDAFSAEAGQEEIVATATRDTPESVYARVRRAVARRCLME